MDKLSNNSLELSKDLVELLLDNQVSLSRNTRIICNYSPAELVSSLRASLKSRLLLICPEEEFLRRGITPEHIHLEAKSDFVVILSSDNSFIFAYKVPSLKDYSYLFKRFEFKIL